MTPAFAMLIALPAASADWLEGCWRHLEGDTIEVWSAPHAAMQFGYSISSRAGEVVAFEQLRIEPSSSGLSYIASPAGGPPVPFGLVEYQAGLAVFENPEHDFPQRIAYQRDGTHLLATIAKLDGSSAVAFRMRPCGSGSGFDFQRLEKQVDIAAPRAEVWAAWTSEEALAFISPQSRIDLIPGGAYEWFLNLPPDEMGRRGGEGARVLAFIPGEMLAFDWTFPPDIPSLRRAGAKTQVVVRFSDLPQGGTRVHFVQHGWQEGEAWRAGYRYFDGAWDYVLGTMKAHLETMTKKGNEDG